MRLTRMTLVRRGWVVPLCTVVVVIVAVGVASLRSSSFRVQALLAVPTSGGPGNTTATPPDTLATTDAELISQDDGVVAAAARATGLSTSAVRGRITATQQPGTSIIAVTFSDSDAPRAALGDAAVVQAATGPKPSASSIPRGALLVVREPGAPQEETRAVPGGPVPIGIVLGLILGLATFIAWDRHDPWAVNSDSVTAELNVPVTEIDTASGNLPSEAVRERWKSLAGQPQVVKVALIPATVRSNTPSGVIAAQLASTEGDAGPHFAFTSPGDGTVEAGLSAVRADLVVLVVSVGDPVRELRRTLQLLRELGAPPQWALFDRSGQ